VSQVNQRLWKIPGQRTPRRAWGFTTQEPGGKQVKRYRSEWSREDAEKALAQHRLGLGQKDSAQDPGLTLGVAVERYLQAKSRKRSIAADKTFLNWFTQYFGAQTPLTQITAARIAAWKAERLSAICQQTGRHYSAAAVNRPLAALSTLLRMARDEWEILPVAPRIRLEKEPQGRLRYLEPEEEVRLLAACRASRNPHLLAIVTIALNTGLRLSELLGLTWDRVDLSRGVIRLEVTKSGRRREVPMRQVVYETLAAMPEPREGRVWRLRDIRTAFESAVKTAKLDNFHFHDLRHTFASWFVMRGGSIQALKELLGHADLKMTLRYAHLSPDHLRDEMARTERPADAPVIARPEHEPFEESVVPANQLI
jgi:integrase